MSAPAPPRTLAAEGAPRGGLAALCITQTTGWGVLHYALLAAVRPISEDTGWDPALVTGPSPPLVAGPLKRLWSPAIAEPSFALSTPPPPKVGPISARLDVRTPTRA
jgi:hypothetical protein